MMWCVSVYVWCACCVCGLCGVVCGAVVWLDCVYNVCFVWWVWYMYLVCVMWYVVRVVVCGVW